VSHGVSEGTIKNDLRNYFADDAKDRAKSSDKVKLERLP